MAKAVDFEGSNDTAMRRDGSGAMPIEMRDGWEVSCYELDADEIAEVNRTGRIWLRARSEQDKTFARTVTAFEARARS